MITRISSVILPKGSVIFDHQYNDAPMFVEPALKCPWVSYFVRGAAGSD